MEYLIATFLPVFIDFVNKNAPDIHINFWKINYVVVSGKVKAIIAWVICILYGVVVNWAALQVGIQTGNYNEFIKNVTIIMAASQAFYDLYWKGSDIRVGVLANYQKGLDAAKKILK